MYDTVPAFLYTVCGDRRGRNAIDVRTWDLVIRRGLPKGRLLSHICDVGELGAFAPREWKLPNPAVGDFSDARDAVACQRVARIAKASIERSIWLAHEGRRARAYISVGPFLSWHEKRRIVPFLQRLVDFKIDVRRRHVERWEICQDFAQPCLWVQGLAFDVTRVTKGGVKMVDKGEQGQVSLVVGLRKLWKGEIALRRDEDGPTPPLGYPVSPSLQDGQADLVPSTLTQHKREKDSELSAPQLREECEEYFDKATLDPTSDVSVDVLSQKSVVYEVWHVLDHDVLCFQPGCQRDLMKDQCAAFVFRPVGRTV